MQVQTMYALMDIPCGRSECWVGRAYACIEKPVWRCMCGWEQAFPQQWRPSVPHPLVQMDAQLQKLGGI